MGLRRWSIINDPLPGITGDKEFLDWELDTPNSPVLGGALEYGFHPPFALKFLIFV